MKSFNNKTNKSIYVAVIFSWVGGPCSLNGWNLDVLKSVSSCLFVPCSPKGNNIKAFCSIVIANHFQKTYCRDKEYLIFMFIKLVFMSALMAKILNIDINIHHNALLECRRKIHS